MWTSNNLVILVLHVFLEIFNVPLSLHLEPVVRANAAQGLVVVLNCIYIVLSLLYRAFQLDRLLQLLVHHISLPFLSLLLSLLVLLVVRDVLLHYVPVDVLHLLLLSFLLLGVVVYHVLKVVVQIHLLLLRM